MSESNESAGEIFSRFYPDPLARRDKDGWKPAVLPQVLLIGLGIPELKAVTQEALAALRACKTLFVYDPSNRFFRAICSDVRPIGKVQDADNNPTLRSFTSRVIAAGKKDGPAGFAVYGHPMLYESLSHRLIEACVRAKATYGVVGGISTADRILAAAGISVFGEVGVQLSSAAHFLKSKPDGTSHVMIFKACEELARLKRVAAHALKSYPPDHRVAIAACELWGPEKIDWCRLDEVVRKVRRPEVFLTLLIPPLAA